MGGRDRVERRDHLLLMTVRGVDDEQVGTGLDKGPCATRDIAVDTDRGRDPQFVGRVDVRPVDTVPQRPDPGEDTGQGAVGMHQHRQCQVQVTQSVEDLSAGCVHRQRDHRRVEDVAYPGEAVDPGAGRFGDDADRTPIVGDDDGRAMSAFG